MPVTSLSEGHRRGIAAMKEVVYPPADHADDPVYRREWLPAGWAVVVTDPDGRVVSYTGIMKSAGTVGDRQILIGGVGGVATHPDSRGQGLARDSIARALDFLEEEGVDFALLVCNDSLVDYYTSLGWRLFPGTTVNRQFGKREVFTFNRVMVHDLVAPAPSDGTIEVLGPLW